MLQAQDSG